MQLTLSNNSFFLVLVHNLGMEKTSHDKLQCSLSVAIATVGDPWSSLILRDLMIFGGTRRFEQLREGLGISRNVLTDRLNTLLNHEIVRKFPIEEGAKRMEYRLSRKGWELMPMLLATHQWCEKWREDPNNSALKFVDAETRQEIATIGVYSQDGKLLGPDSILAEPKTDNAREYLTELKTAGNKKPL